MKTSGALFQGNISQQTQQLSAIFCISGIGRAAGIERGKTSGMNAGSALEGIDFEAGVIGEDEGA